MPEDRAPPRTVGNAAEAAAWLGEKYPLSPERASQLVTDGVFSGEVSAVWIDSHGRRREATPADFAKPLDFDPPTPESAIVPEGDAVAGFSMVIRIIEDDLEINLLSLDRFAEKLLGAAPAVSSEPELQKNRGGRPRKHNWGRAIGQIMLRVRDYGMPSRPAELVRELSEWFGRTSSEPPDQRHIERFVADIWPRGDADLGPSE